MFEFSLLLIKTFHLLYDLRTDNRIGVGGRLGVIGFSSILALWVIQVHY